MSKERGGRGGPTRRERHLRQAAGKKRERKKKTTKTTETVEKKMIVGSTLKAKMTPKVSPARSPNRNLAPSSEKLKKVTKALLKEMKRPATHSTFVINIPKITCRRMPIPTSFQSMAFRLLEKRNANPAISKIPTKLLKYSIK